MWESKILLKDIIDSCTKTQFAKESKDHIILHSKSKQVFVALRMKYELYNNNDYVAFYDLLLFQSSA